MKNNLDFVILAYYVIGAAIGLLAAAKIISILLKKCKTGTYCAIIGLIVGSLPAIYPKEFALNGEGIIAIVIFIIGAALPIVMKRMGKGSEKSDTDDNQPTVE